MKKRLLQCGLDSLSKLACFDGSNVNFQSNRMVYFKLAQSRTARIKQSPSKVQLKNSFESNIFKFGTHFRHQNSCLVQAQLNLRAQL